MAIECAMMPMPRGRPRGDDAGDRSNGDADIVGASSERRCTCRSTLAPFGIRVLTTLQKTGSVNHRNAAAATRVVMQGWKPGSQPNRLRKLAFSEVFLFVASIILC